MSNTMEVGDADFDSEVLKSSTPVLVDFWADWCAPCKMVAPVVEDLAKEYDGKMKFLKLNVDDNPRAPQSYGIRGIPTLLIFHGGKPVEQVVGAVPKSELKKRIESALAKI
ncbi:MAG: thioredoxin [Chloroflexi bacterium]|nr:thioredoxin [Chloroflexota bacterium]